MTAGLNGQAPALCSFCPHRIELEQIKVDETAGEADRRFFAWAAGFFDGEGCIAIVKPRGTYQIRAMVNQVDPRPLELLRSRFGGGLHKRERGPDSPSRDIYAWQISCQKAEAFLRAIRPYLTVKAEQVNRALAFQERRLPRGQGHSVEYEPTREQRQEQDEDDFLALQALKRWEGPAEAKMELFTGGYVDLARPRSEDIKIEDIARALSLQCRFNGHIPSFYSIAEHAMFVHDLVCDLGHPELGFAALHHDSHEAFLTDLVTPLKEELGIHVDVLAAQFDNAIADAFGLEPQEFHHSEIKAADTLALRHEAAHFKPSHGTAGAWPWREELPKPKFWKPGERTQDQIAADFTALHLSYINGERKVERQYCHRGHALTDENVYVRPSGKRECRQCGRERNREASRRYRERRKRAKAAGAVPYA